MNCFAFVLLILVPLARSDPNYKPIHVVCTSTWNRKSCPEDLYYRDKVKSKGHCPGCVRLKGLGGKCENDEDCQPGLFCPKPSDQGTRRCCDDKRQVCEYYKRNNEVYISTKYWEPDCLPNGLYAAKQCKGEKLWGKCFCTIDSGERIFGEKSWMDATNMICKCSRLSEEIGRTRKDVSLHCSEDGNFEALQCDNGICWCANEKTGKPYTPVVPESMTRILPCFEENNFGSQYLRRCDSINVHAQRAARILKNHGLEIILLPTVNCNYDGSYARVQRMGQKKYCVYKNKQKLCDPADGIKDCNCMYDRFVAGIEEKKFRLECDDFGSYKEIQAQGDYIFKVDSDGCPYEFKRIGNRG